MKMKKSALASTLYGASLALLTMTSNAVVMQDDAAQIATTQSTTLSSNFAQRFIVTYDDSSANAQLLTANSASTMAVAATRASGVGMQYLRKTATGSHVFKLDKKLTQQQAQAAMLKLSAQAGIANVEVDELMQPMATPSDPSYNNQWHYYEATGGLNLPDAWDTSTGSGVVVAVLDTGYTAHADLLPNLLPGYDMISDAGIANDGNGRDSDARDTGDATSANECGDGGGARSSSWHGSHVAGTVAAATNNGIGVAGVAYDAKVVPVRVLGKCGGYTSDIADGIIWAAGGSVSGIPSNPNPADVINMSLGGSGSCGSTTQDAINQAVSLGATVVVAAGNSNTNASGANPANCNNVVTVASIGRSGSRAYYSNYGSVVDVAAPGGDQSTGTSDGVLSTVNTGSGAPAGDGYAYFQGTSMAAPHVAGAAALLYAVDSGITPAEVESILKSTARSFPGSCSSCGSGIVDATAAVAAASGTPPPTGGSVLEKGVAKTGLSGSAANERRYTIEVPAGATDLTITMSGGSGDADLYTRFGSAPTTTTYDCRPYLSGNNESCSVASPSAGTYHVMIRGYSAYSGVSIVADYTAGGGGGGQADSIDESGVAGARNSWQAYTLDVPAGQSQLSVQISGGSGDADLYVRYGANPTTSAYDCRPYRNGNNETCTISNPQAGTWYIRIRGYSAYSGVRLQASSQ
ncbi:S8 family peptidase [Arenicella xantha]|uniref:Serine protease n=1 Tax=Arenicella xantha TaxID=644221 RepID=A0A395JP23_9GAMM|nr:S8 family peptidase [Arenicella xantha]RBP53073.1 serine protease [Arenicella xantha]